MIQPCMGHMGYVAKDPPATNYLRGSSTLINKIANYVENVAFKFKKFSAAH
jgi:hypothetical protein